MRDHLGARSNINKKHLREIEGKLPSEFWVVEFSLAEIYAVNQNAFGEILINLSPSRADIRKMKLNIEDNVLIGARFINVLDFGEDTYDIGLKSHYPLLRRELSGVNSL
jgi:hypothetical protein